MVASVSIKIFDFFHQYEMDVHSSAKLTVGGIVVIIINYNHHHHYYYHHHPSFHHFSFIAFYEQWLYMMAASKLVTLGSIAALGDEEWR